MTETTKQQRNHLRPQLGGCIDNVWTRLLADADRLAEVEVTLRAQIDSEERAANGWGVMGSIDRADECRNHAHTLRRILDGGEKDG